MRLLEQGESPLLSALQKGRRGVLPVWLMRQAGRALKRYRKLREGVDFLTFLKEVEYAGKATLLPVEDLKVDGAILFHDLLLPLEGLGVKVFYPDGAPPYLSVEVFSREEASSLFRNERDVEEFYTYLLPIVGYVKENLPSPVPLIGFVSAPFTLAVYLAGGKGERFKEWIYKDPEGVEEYLTRLGDFLARCGVFQRIGGVDLIQIFDSHLLSLPLSFTERYRKVLDRFVASLPPPRIYFARGWGVFFPYLKDLPVEGFSLDPQISLRFVRESVGLKYTLQGNLDPVVLLTDRSTIRREVGRMLEGFSSDPAYIANLGHGVLPETPEDHLKYFVDLVHEYSFRL